MALDFTTAFAEAAGSSRADVDQYGYQKYNSTDHNKILYREYIPFFVRNDDSEIRHIISVKVFDFVTNEVMCIDKEGPTKYYGQPTIDNPATIRYKNFSDFENKAMIVEAHTALTQWAETNSEPLPVALPDDFGGAPVAPNNSKDLGMANGAVPRKKNTL